MYTNWSKNGHNLSEANPNTSTLKKGVHSVQTQRFAVNSRAGKWTLVKKCKYTNWPKNGR